MREDSLLERATSSMEVQNTNLMMVQTVCEGINIIILNLVSVCVHKYCIRWLFAVSFTNIIFQHNNRHLGSKRLDFYDFDTRVANDQPGFSGKQDLVKVCNSNKI